MKYVLIIFVLLLVLIAVMKLKSKKKWESKFKEKFNLNTKTVLGKLVNGHPDIDKEVVLCCSFEKDKKLFIYDYLETDFSREPIFKGIIPFESITNILAEDQSTIESRITATRLLLVGVFALAWKKKKKNELGYLTVFWNDGKFDHETVFEFEGKDAIQRANTVRNNLIRNINNK